MHECVDWMRPVDTDILNFLKNIPSAKLTAGNIAANVDYHRTYVSKRCKILTQQELLGSEGGGSPYYRVTDKGLSTVAGDIESSELRDLDRVYEGERLEGDWTRVEVGGKPLEPRNDLLKDTTTKFEWGYVGAGPAHLAAAMLADVVGDEKAEEWKKQFCKDVTAGFSDGWELTAREIRDYVAEKESDPHPQ